MSTATPDSVPDFPKSRTDGGARDTVWQIARARLHAARQKRAVLIETGAISVLMLLIFQPAMASWERRWTLPESPQGYAVIVLPLTIAWLWLNRMRLALPELGVLLKRTADNKVKRRSSLTGKRNDGPNEIQRMDHNLAEVAPLLREHQPVWKRLRWPLALGCLITALGIWMNEPTITGIAFVVMLIGLIAYRQGALMLRCAAFPLFLLATAIPIPGLILDPIMPIIQHQILNLVLHVLLNAGLIAEISPDGNPLTIVGPPAVQVWSGSTGLGVGQMAAFLLVTVWYLSLVQAKFSRKFWLVVLAVLIAITVMTLRFALVTWAGMSDSEMIKYVGPVSLYLAPVIAFGIEYAFIRGFKCQKYHRWVSI